MSSLETSIRSILERAGVEQIHKSPEGLSCTCPRPEHDDAHPSCTINTTTGMWFCHGCQTGGGLQYLAMCALDLTGKEAAKLLEYTELLKKWPELPPLDERHVETSFMPEAAVSAYLGLCPHYLLSRGFTKSFLREMQVGYDPMALRAVFPIRDVHGRLVGLTRRATLSHQEPRYLHTTFERAGHFYLGEQLPTLEPGQCVYVCEGHLDALRLMQLYREDSKVARKLTKRGCAPAVAVAQMGGKLTKIQAKLLARYADVVVLAYDRDDAGRIAHNKAVELLAKTGIRDVYRLAYNAKDPGDLTDDSKVALRAAA